MPVMSLYCIYFFFSSRRRHTRYWRDWSSDVCSSDLGALGVSAAVECRRAVDLVVEAPAPGRLAAAPRPRRVAALDHEALDDAVEDDAVVEALLGQQPEVLGRLRRLVLQQLEADSPHVRLDACDAVSHDSPLSRQ